MMTRLQNFLHTIGLEFQQVENCAESLAQNINIDRAQGAVLDEYGSDIEITRPVGMSDEDYRILIRALWQVLRSSGTTDELINATKIATDASVIKIWEPLAGEGILFTMFINSDTSHNAYVIYKSKSAGVPFELILGEYGGPVLPNFTGEASDAQEAFYPSATGYDLGLGFSELDHTHIDAEIMIWNGGQLTELITQ